LDQEFPRIKLDLEIAEMRSIPKSHKLDPVLWDPDLVPYTDEVDVESVQKLLAKPPRLLVATLSLLSFKAYCRLEYTESSF
jgi:hypothetical protein